MHSMRIPVLLLVLTLGAPGLLTCQEEGAESTQPVVIPSAVKEELRRLLPDPALISAAPSDETKFYSSNLFEYIDGGADVYLDYGLVALLHQEYKSSSADITLDVYDLGSPGNAFGIYAAESSPDYHFLRVGAEGYGTNEILNFLQGKFYVKLSAFSDTEKTGPMLERLAQAVAQRMGPPAPMPDFLTLFPPEQLVGHSVKYVKKAPLGHEFLAPAITASYGTGGKPASIVISKAADSQAALKKLELVKDYFASSGKVTPMPGVAPGAFRATNQFEGEAIFVASNSFVVVCINPPLNPGPLLKAVIERIGEKGGTISF